MSAWRIGGSRFSSPRQAARDQELVERRLQELREVARGSDNLLPPIRQALKDSCSLGEVCGAMREVFGDYQPTS